MWKNLIVAFALVAVPTLAFADRAKDAGRAQANADRARDSSAKHAAKGNTASATNMAKIADQRQKAADRHSAAAARDTAKKKK